MPSLELDHGTLSYEALAERLAERFHVIAPDMLGHGESERLDAFTLEDQATALNQLIVHDGYPEAHVVGYSMGSYIAARAAIQEPDHVQRLVLVCPKAAGRTSSTVTAAERAGLDPETASADDLMAALQEAIWSSATDADRRREILHEVNAAENLSREERRTNEESIEGFDLRPGLPTVTARTLVLSGAEDGLNPPEAGRAVADLIPGARFEVYERSGHMLPYEETERFTADVTAFLTAD